VRIPEPEVGLARSPGLCMRRSRHPRTVSALADAALLIRGSGRAAAYRSSYRTRTLTVAYETYAMAMTCLRG
jgi:hypothetical protein